MTRTAVVYSPEYLRHNTGRGHPESADRLRAITHELMNGQLSNRRNWQFVEPTRASIEDIGLVHDIDYVKHVKSVCKSGGGLLDAGDTMVSPESFEVARLAVGGALRAVNLVMEEQFENAFALVRPPGHHAENLRACGFCIFNNVAIAAEYLLRKVKMKRVAIVDVDAHHGNGTQEVFYETDEVLYLSLHEDPRGFPGTGFVDEVGRGKGLGFNVNVPLPFRTTDQVYLRAMEEIVAPIIGQYKPQFILISAGLDSHYSDPVGSLSLSALCYGKVFEAITRLASHICNGRVVSVLEGGYSPKFTGKIAALAIAKMSDSPYVVHDRIRKPRKSLQTRGEKIVEEVKKAQKSFWDLA